MLTGPAVLPQVTQGGANEMAAGNAGALLKPTWHATAHLQESPCHPHMHAHGSHECVCATVPKSTKVELLRFTTPVATHTYTDARGVTLRLVVHTAGARLFSVALPCRQGATHRGTIPDCGKLGGATFASGRKRMRFETVAQPCREHPDKQPLAMVQLGQAGQASQEVWQMAWRFWQPLQREQPEYTYSII